MSATRTISAIAPPIISARQLVRRTSRGVTARWRAAQFLRRVKLDMHVELLAIGDRHLCGYEIPAGLLNANSVVLSAGAGTDVTFESLLVDRFGCRVYLLDPVPAAAAYVHEALAHEPRITFEQAALWNADTSLEFHEPVKEGFVSHSATNLHHKPVAFTAKAHALGSMRTKHGWDHIDLLKISVEGSEFTILDAIVASNEPITAVCVEFSQPASVDRVGKITDKMRSAGYLAVAQTGEPFGWTMTFLRR